ncbi:MAG: site-2 protease family protein [Planctomycetes bacterium]|nr:site-2 protease family protein [Planctomycetota bacterium]
MNFLALSAGDIDMTSIVMWLAAWFLTIGLHEGSHAWVAYWLGDDTAYRLGKRSLNPLRHIDFHDRNNLIATVVIPVITVFTIGWPLGIAWVPVNPSNFRHPTRDMALTSLAGPAGNVIGSLIGFIVLAVAILLIGQNREVGAEMPVGVRLLFDFGIKMFILNILLGTINLIPAPGVDGGSVLYHFLNQNERQTFDKLRPYGLLIFVGIVWFVLNKPIQLLISFAGNDVPTWLMKVLT